MDNCVDIYYYRLQIYKQYPHFVYRLNFFELFGFQLNFLAGVVCYIKPHLWVGFNVWTPVTFGVIVQ